MCSHNLVKINDMRICTRCGMTVLPNGMVIFDRNLPNYKGKRKKRGKNNGKK